MLLNVFDLVDVKIVYEKSSFIVDILVILLEVVYDLMVMVCDGYVIFICIYVVCEISWVDLLLLLVYFYGGGFIVGSIKMYD